MLIVAACLGRSPAHETSVLGGIVKVQNTLGVHLHSTFLVVSLNNMQAIVSAVRGAARR